MPAIPENGYGAGTPRMAIPDQWQETTDALREKFSRMKQTDSGWDIPADLSVQLAAIRTSDWTNYRRTFTFSQIDPEKLVAVCRAGLVQWWPGISGHAARGNLDAVRYIYSEYEKTPTSANGDKISLGALMSWASYPTAFYDGGEKLPGNYAVLKQILDWGADPNFESGKYLDKTLRQSAPDIIALMLERGGKVDAADKALDELVKAKNFAQAANILKAQGIDGFFTKVDEGTLLETKYVNEQGEGSQFKTLFNFKAQRVTEVYDNGKYAALNSYPFTGYNTKALQKAQETLERLGGLPAEVLPKPRAKFSGTKP